MAAIKLSEQERLLAIIALGCVIFYVFFQFLIAPKLAESGKLKNRLRERRLDLDVAERKLKILAAIEKSVGLVPERSAAPREEKALEVLKLLSQATDKSGLNLVFVKPLLEEAGEGLKFNLSCLGSYRELYNFLNILYRLRVLVLIDNLNIVSSGGREPVLDIKVALTAYY